MAAVVLHLERDEALSLAQLLRCGCEAVAIDAARAAQGGWAEAESIALADLAVGRWLQQQLAQALAYGP